MKIYTIGYEGLDQRQFVSQLTRYNVDVIADIRKLPVSRKKGFSKTPLKALLNDKNIEYINFRELGAPKDMREELYRSGNYVRFFEKYLKSISDKQNFLKDIYSLICQGKKVTLLCFERDPQLCHRKVVAEEIKRLDGNGLEVKHIVPFS